MLGNLRPIFIAAAVNFPAGAALAQLNVDMSTTPYIVCGSVESFTGIENSDRIPFEFQTEWSYIDPDDQIFKESDVSCCSYSFAAQSVGRLGQSGPVYTFYKINPARNNIPGQATPQLWDEINSACLEHIGSGTLTAGSTCDTGFMPINCQGSAQRSVQDANVAAIRSAVSADANAPKHVASSFIMSREQILGGFDASGLGRPTGPISNAEEVLSNAECRKLTSFSRALDSVNKAGAGAYDCNVGFVVVNESVMRIPERRRAELGAERSFNYLIDDDGRRLSTARQRFDNISISVSVFSNAVDEDWLKSVIDQIHPL